ncbi:helix-turn-helix transcriptional regulator [Enterocloster clostridioformis]|uniref:helix-turn-helix domain-containing protein n=1 Tax=Enterocloster clostridioformis TaxID=1531 RepID=UPI002675801B|nr:helix-turn-helix transcriptional regulator [Enterocloster clostridioformis]
MKGATTIQERLWELRKDKGLNLEELSKQTGISKSALASYESNDYKEINHGNLITLADFYEVSLDYLFCRTENREQINTPLMELHLSDEMVELLKNGRINNRLLCEIATNDKFGKLMADTDIYIDGHATALFQDINESLEKQRLDLIGQHSHADGDLYSETLLVAQVEEEDFFCHVTHKTWDAILHDIRKAHEHDIESTPDFSLAKKMALEIQKALKFPGDHLAKIWKVIFNLLDIDFDKLTTDEQKVLKKVLSKSPVIKNNPLNFRRRGK